MTPRFRVDRILGDRPLTEIGEPALALEGGRLPVVAGAYGEVAGAQEFGRTAPVGVYGTDGPECRALLRVPPAPYDDWEDEDAWTEEPGTSPVRAFRVCGPGGRRAVCSRARRAPVPVSR